MVYAISYARVYEPHLPLVWRSPAWTRLEPQSRAGDPAVGLVAETADPLWMLGRQWQVGEWVGEDAGTPLVARMLGRAVPLTRWQPGAWDLPPADVAPARDLPSDVPWEWWVEPEPTAGAGLRPKAEAAAALLAMLTENGWAKAAQRVVAHFPAPMVPPADARWAGPATIVAGRLPDADAVADAIDGGLPGWWTSAVPAGERTAARAAAADWLAWYREEVAPSGGTEAWVGRRLEHRFSVAGEGAVLRAPAYGAGRAARGIDWWALDLDADATDLDPPAGEPEAVPLDQRVLATPLAFPGMPASRFWEMEDGDVDLGSVGADPHDLARLLVVECGLVFGGDWLVLPLDVPAGAYVQLASVTYRTTFGETFVVREVPDPSLLRRALSDSPWRMWTTTVEPRAWEARSTAEGDVAQLTGLLVPPTVGDRLEGDPVEEVLFLRDEAANLVWAVERIVTADSGDATSPRPSSVVPEDTGGPVVTRSELDYLLQTTVPAWWIPYLPTTDGYASVELVQGAMLRFGPTDPQDGSPVQPTGRLLTDPAHARLAEEEVPRDGVRVQRVPVVSRDASGRYRSWTVRRVTVGRGEGRSGLAFDLATPRRGA